LLLLDKQAARWVLDDSPRLGPHARQIIVSATAVHVSAAAVWELLTADCVLLNLGCDFILDVTV
jgi:PIN domain nuclease of toxin-antitoxin system